MKEDWVDAIALKIRPELQKRSGLLRAGPLLDMSIFIATAPSALIGIIWLIFKTEGVTFGRDWPTFLLFALLLILFNRTTFQLEMSITREAAASASGNLSPFVEFAAILILGPTVIWVFLLITWLEDGWEFWHETTSDLRWSKLSHTMQQTGILTVNGLVAIFVYERLGGSIPLNSLMWQAIWPAFVAFLVSTILQTLFLIPFSTRVSRVIRAYEQDITQTQWHFFIFLFVSINISSVATPFGILAAGIFTIHGLGIFLFLMLGIYGASLLAYRLSNAVSKSQQRSRELAILEELGHAIIDAPLDHDVLPDLLQTYLPGMFSRAILAVWRDDEIIYSNSNQVTLPRLDEAMKWVNDGGDNAPFEMNNLQLPHEVAGRRYRKGLAVPIKTEDQSILGGIYVAKREDFGDVFDFLPALQSLAGQISSAIQRLSTYEQTLANVRMSRELEIAGQIQNSFLPDTIPDLDGWELTAKLVAARQTSGDFYDFVALENGRLAIIVADVADKGTGAALYMALSRTLIRTYAMAHPDHPELALQLANERILIDTKSDQFVTVFLGILDPVKHHMVYANAGHNPAFLFSPNTAVQSLGNTGIPLGMFEGMQWKRNSVEFAQGDVLVVYTDGVTEAQDALQDEFGEQQLIKLVEDGMKNGRTAPEIEAAILTAIQGFVGNAPQFDDITLLISHRIA
ncbi:MAG: PP2C family protein-serine/threonine phosphatase [Chloroflexota bacterium]